MSPLFRKNTFQQPLQVRKNNVALFALLMMIAGFFISRIVLSMGMMVFGVAGLWGVSPKKWLLEKWWLLGVAWVGMFALSGFWSDNYSFWEDRFQVKFPFLLLPLAFAFVQVFKEEKLKAFLAFLNFCVLAAIAYSLFFFFKDVNGFVENYSFAHLLPTLPKNDHIRFSMMVALTICFNVLTYPVWNIKWQRGLIFGLCLFFAAYLHLLAARSGLMALYVFVVMWLLFLLAKKKTRLTGALLLLTFTVFVAFAFTKIPTLKKRVNYIIYTFETYQKQGLAANYSDMGRIISYDIALRKIAEYPVVGVGSGDVLFEMKSGYRKWYPEVKEKEMLMPHNQFLVVAMSCGIPALLLFIGWLCYPLLKIKRTRSGYFLLMAWLMLLLPLLAEPMLEVQFGVFVYLFFMLLFYFYHRHKTQAFLS